MNTSVDRYIRMPEVKHLTTLSKAQIYSLIRQGKFPKQTHLGERTSVWRLSQITDWMDQFSEHNVA